MTKKDIYPFPKYFDQYMDLAEELILIRQSYIAMCRYFIDEILLRIGNGYNSQYSVLSIAFLIAGHQRWHLKVVEEKYFPLLVV